MKKFILQVSLFFLILLAFKLLQSILIFDNLNPNDSLNFYGKESSKPRIILVGSSNLDYNYDYEKLNETFTNYDVLGCNLNEPSGLYATIYKLKQLNPTEDDIVIFALPHSLYEPSKLLPLGSSGKKGYSSKMVLDCLKDFPLEFMGSIMNIQTSQSIKLLSESHEQTTHTNNVIQFSLTTDAKEHAEFLDCVQLEGPFDISSTGFDETYLVDIQNYLSFTISAKILYRYPVVKESEYQINLQRIKYLSSHYTFINDFDDSIYPDGNWYNQWYHLNKCGRELNTRKLINEMKPVLKL